MLNLLTQKTGFAFSGAAARIAQECALSEALIEGLTPLGRKIVPDVVSGSSSGALNAVAVNAVLMFKETNGRKGMGWETYKSILFGLRNENVFDLSARGIARILRNNIAEGFLLDTSPLRKLLEDTLVRMGFDTLGSLFLQTYISVVNTNKRETMRLSSRDPSHSKLSLLDVLMASTAIAVAFKPQKIDGLDGEFVDGCTGRDGIPVESLARENCSELYVISKMRGEKEPKGEEFGPRKLFKTPKILSNYLEASSILNNDMFLCQLERAPYIARRAYVYMPKLSRSYSMLDFDTQREQYEETRRWAEKNAPEKLEKTSPRWWERLK